MLLKKWGMAQKAACTDCQNRPSRLRLLILLVLASNAELSLAAPVHYLPRSRLAPRQPEIQNFVIHVLCVCAKKEVKDFGPSVCV